MESFKSEGAETKEWVKFVDEENESRVGNSEGGQSSAAVVDAVVQVVSSTSISLDARTNNSPLKANNGLGQSQAPHQNTDQLTRTNNSGFTNGDVIVSVLPINTRWPWITPATFRPEFVPEDLIVPGLTLTVEEYVHAMELLTSDFRFNIYTICYKRLLASWLLIAFFILIVILFSGVVGIHLFTLGISWLIVNAAAVFFCLYIKIKINKGVEECMGRVNNLFLKHKLLCGLDDRGRMSCHKVHLCFIYFDPCACIEHLDQVMQNRDSAVGQAINIEISHPTCQLPDQPRTRRIPLKQNGERLFLKYVQRWCKDFLRRRLDWTIGEGTENPSAPRHLTSALCPCQYIEEYIRHKPRGEANSKPCISCPPFEISKIFDPSRITFLRRMTS